MPWNAIDRAPKHLNCCINTPAAKLADPDVQIEVGNRMLDVHATELHGSERDDRYAEQARRYPGFAEYERMTPRQIPVVVLEAIG